MGTLIPTLLALGYPTATRTGRRPPRCQVELRSALQPTASRVRSRSATPICSYEWLAGLGPSTTTQWPAGSRLHDPLVA